MLSLWTFALVSALCVSSTVAAPVHAVKPNTISGRSSIMQVKNPSFKKNPTLAHAKAYHKYGAMMPAHLEAAVLRVTTGGEGEVSAVPMPFDVEYVSPVTIGGKTLRLDFDTGSSDLWVFSSDLPTAEQTGHTVFDPTNSSTWTLLPGYSWAIKYVDGSGASGIVGTDTVNVGGVTVTSQAVEAATSVSTGFASGTANDGLLGLAMDSANTVTPTAQKTFFFNALASLDSPVFTADLKWEAPGTYDFGYIDAFKYTGNITYAAINPGSGFWMVESSGYKVGSSAFVAHSSPSIVDTGTTLLYMDAVTVEAYYAQVAGSQYSSLMGAYVFDCSASLPDLCFGIGTYRAIISGKYVNYGTNTDGTCYGGLQLNTGFGFQVLGDIMFKSQFVVFNGATSEVGFAAKP